jgi:hypothetical protein
VTLRSNSFWGDVPSAFFSPQVVLRDLRSNYFQNCNTSCEYENNAYYFACPYLNQSTHQQSTDVIIDSVWLEKQTTFLNEPLTIIEVQTTFLEPVLFMEAVSCGAWEDTSLPPGDEKACPMGTEQLFENNITQYEGLEQDSFKSYYYDFESISDGLLVNFSFILFYKSQILFIF